MTFSTIPKMMASSMRPFTMRQPMSIPSFSCQSVSVSDALRSRSFASDAKPPSQGKTADAQSSQRKRFGRGKKFNRREDSISSASFIDNFKDPPQDGVPKYVLPSIPFPLNPYYKPEAPLSEESRKAIFRLFTSSPARWTPYELANYFGISIDRVKAIIRLKALEVQYKNAGKPIQTNFTKGMENMLGSMTLTPPPLEKVDFDSRKSAKKHSSKDSKTPANPDRMEPLRITQLSNERQPFLLQLVDDEDDSLNWLDVSKLLMREPFANIVIKVNKDAMSVFEPDGPTRDTAHAIKNIETSNQRMASKASFMITDTSSPGVGTKTDAMTPSTSYNKKKEEVFANVVIRESDGSLRRLTQYEKWKMKNVKPLEFAQQ